MKVFGDLTVPLKTHTFGEFIAQIDQLNVVDWQRNLAREREVWGDSNSKACCFIFARKENIALPRVNLWLQSAKERAYVSNIVPVTTGRLTVDEYNSLLKMFFREVVSPAAAKLEITPELSKTDIGLEDIVSAETANALVAFSANANKSTSSSHPLDKLRWNDFVIVTHRRGDNFPIELLSKWLVQDGWDEESTYELVIQFEQGTDLLKQYDGADY